MHPQDNGCMQASIPFHNDRHLANAFSTLSWLHTSLWALSYLLYKYLKLSLEVFMAADVQYEITRLFCFYI